MLSTDVDLVARGATAALLLLSLTRLLAHGGWRLPRRLAVAIFLVTVVSYLVCSAPGAPVQAGGAWTVLLVLCLIGAPAFWLAARSVFDDQFRPAWTDAMVFAGFLVLGLSAVGPWHDDLSFGASIAFRVASLVVVVHALWIMLRDVRTDLVDRRRRLRVVLVGGVGLYLLAFLILEGYLGQTAQRASWSTLNVLGILVLAFPVTIFAFTLHMILRNALGHSGHEVFPRAAVTRRWLGWSTTVTHHHLHHERARGNFGLYFSWWDRLCRTQDPGYPGAFAAATDGGGVHS